MASKSSEPTIGIPVHLWARLTRDLRLRGLGRRESGAFLLGKQSGPISKVTTYVCYDDIDPAAYQGGAIAFHAQGYAALWQRCRESKLELLADAHTHPTEDVRQSRIDRRNPMVPVVGHTALIIPDFGNTRWWSVRDVGVYEYLGEFRWRTHNGDQQPPRFKLTLW